MLNDETAAKLTNLLNETEHRPFPYSGRGMAGRECIAVKPESTNEFLAVFADLLEVASDTGEGSELAAIQDDVDTIISALRLARTDTLGNGIVVYWPEFDFQD